MNPADQKNNGVADQNNNSADHFTNSLYHLCRKVPKKLIICAKRS
jgi:hypothetical protein